MGGKLNGQRWCLTLIFQLISLNCYPHKSQCGHSWIGLKLIHNDLAYVDSLLTQVVAMGCGGGCVWRKSVLCLRMQQCVLWNILTGRTKLSNICFYQRQGLQICQKQDVKPRGYSCNCKTFIECILKKITHFTWKLLLSWGREAKHVHSQP